MMESQSLENEIKTLKITPESRGYLEETAKWGRIISICGFLFSALIIIPSIGTLFGIGTAAEAGNLDTAFMTGLVAFYLLIGVLFFLPNYYMYNFSKDIKASLESSDSLTMVNGMKNLKSTFKYYGLSIILIILAYFGAMMFALSFGDQF